jgi:hypothetical protein
MAVMKQPFRINVDLTACLIGSTVYSVHDDDANLALTPVKSRLICWAYVALSYLDAGATMV